MQAISNKSRELLTHTITDDSQENTTTYTWNAMWSHHSCPCCSYGLLRHISNGGIYWRCSHCYQEMPVWDISKCRANSHRSVPLHESQSKHPHEISNFVKTAAMVSQEVSFDSGKKIKGRKQFITVDTLGLVLRVLVTAANVGERAGGQQVFKLVKQSQPQSRLTTIWVDGGFDGEPFMQWVMNFCRWIIQVVLRPEQTRGFVLLKKRWVVELLTQQFAVSS